MSRPAGYPAPKPSKSKYVAKRDRKGNILWDKMPQTKPWTCFIPEHKPYEAPETKICLHPDCLGPITATVGYPVVTLLHTLSDCYRKQGRSSADLSQDIAVALITVYSDFDIPITTAHGVLALAIRRVYRDFIKQNNLNDSCVPKTEIEEAVRGYMDISVSEFPASPERHLLRREMFDTLAKRIPDAIVAYLLGIISSADLIKLGYYPKQLAVYRETARHILMEAGYGPRQVKAIEED